MAIRNLVLSTITHDDIAEQARVTALDADCERDRHRAFVRVLARLERHYSGAKVVGIAPDGVLVRHPQGDESYWINPFGTVTETDTDMAGCEVGRESFGLAGWAFPYVRPVAQGVAA